MPHKVFSKIYLHFTWHTKGNESMLTDEILKILNYFIKQKCKNTREVIFISFWGYMNHVHLAVKIPPTVNISRWIGEIKGSSSHELKDFLSSAQFAWQEGYGIVSFSERDLKMIVDYIQNQAQHHESNKLFDSLERIEE